jgi:hypothetical protein
MQLSLFNLSEYEGERQGDTSGGALFRKKPIVVEATRWFKNGDHPGDDCHMVYPDPGSTTQFEPFLSEGRVVRRFRLPDIPCSRLCVNCGKPMEDHGRIETLEGEMIVCPGDWIITGVNGEHYPRKPDIFEMTYEPVPE